MASGSHRKPEPNHQRHATTERQRVAGCRSWLTLIDLWKRCSFTNLQLTAHVKFQTLPSFLRVLDWTEKRQVSRKETRNPLTRTGLLVVRPTMGLSKSAVPCSEV